MEIKLKMKPISEIIKSKGLDENGDVQKFHTANVNRRIGKYMPHLNGVLETKKKIVRGTQIVVLGPYAKYQYHGKVMVGPAPKVVTDRPLNYTKNAVDGNPQAGPYWDRALVAAEGDALVADVQRYIDSKK